MSASQSPPPNMPSSNNDYSGYNIVGDGINNVSSKNLEWYNGFNNHYNITESRTNMRKVVVHAGIHQLNDAQLAMKLLDKYLEYIENKLTELEMLAAELHNTDTFSVFDGTAYDMARIVKEIDNVIDMARYNGKPLILNSSIEPNSLQMEKERVSLTAVQKTRYRFRWNIAQSYPVFNNTNLAGNDLIIEPQQISVSILGLTNLFQERGSVYFEMNGSHTLSDHSYEDGKFAWVDPGCKISFHQDRTLTNQVEAVVAILVTDQGLNPYGKHYIKGKLLGKSEGTNCGINELRAGPSFVGSLRGITRSGKTNDQVAINEQFTDPFSVFVEGNDYFHNLSDGYNTDLDEIVRNILIAKDKIMMARLDTQGRMDMISTRRDQIMSQFKNENAIVNDIAALIEQAQETESYYYQILTKSLNNTGTSSYNGSIFNPDTTVGIPNDPSKFF